MPFVGPGDHSLLQEPHGRGPVVSWALVGLQPFLASTLEASTKGQSLGEAVCGRNHERAAGGTL